MVKKLYVLYRGDTRGSFMLPINHNQNASRQSTCNTPTNMHVAIQHAIHQSTCTTPTTMHSINQHTHNQSTHTTSNNIHWSIHHELHQSIHTHNPNTHDTIQLALHQSSCETPINMQHNQHVNRHYVCSLSIRLRRSATHGGSPRDHQPN